MDSDVRKLAERTIADLKALDRPLKAGELTSLERAAEMLERLDRKQKPAEANPKPVRSALAEKLLAAGHEPAPPAPPPDVPPPNAKAPQPPEPPPAPAPEPPPVAAPPPEPDWLRAMKAEAEARAGRTIPVPPPLTSDQQRARGDKLDSFRSHSDADGNSTRRRSQAVQAVPKLRDRTPHDDGEDPALLVT
jgi:hypothetical protein